MCTKKKLSLKKRHSLIYRNKSNTIYCKSLFFLSLTDIIIIQQINHFHTKAIQTDRKTDSNTRVLKGNKSFVNNIEKILKKKE